MEIAAIVGGIACGVLAALPAVLQLRRPEEERGMRRALMAAAFSFLLIQGVLVALLFASKPLAAPVGISATLTFLIVVVVASLRR